MSKINTVKMSATLDGIALGLSYAEIARRNKMSERTIYFWITRSNNNDPKTILSWGEFGEAQFMVHHRSAVAMSIARGESNSRAEFAEGYWLEDVIFQGQRQYELDPYKVGLTDDECMALYNTKDRYLREVDGSAIPLRVRRKISDNATKLHLAAHLPHLYGDRSSVTINGNVSHSVRQIPRPGDQAEVVKQIENKPQEFSPVAPPDPAQAKPQIALGRPAKDSAELDAWAQRGDLDPKQVEFTTLDGQSKMIGEPPAGPIAQPATEGTPMQNKKLEILPTDNAMVREMKTKFNQKLDDIAAGKVSPAIPMVPRHGDNFNDPPEITGGQPVEEKKTYAPKQATPADGVPEAITAQNYKMHPRYAEALERRAAGQPENAIDQQLLNGNWAVLSSYQSRLDHVGQGQVRPGGTAHVEPKPARRTS